MAWWNNPAGGRTPGVSLERVAAWFDANGFAYELTEDNPGIAAGFADECVCIAAGIADERAMPITPTSKTRDSP